MKHLKDASKYETMDVKRASATQSLIDNPEQRGKKDQNATQSFDTPLNSTKKVPGTTMNKSKQKVEKPIKPTLTKDNSAPNQSNKHELKRTNTVLGKIPK